MSNVVVGIIDPFHPAIIEAIARALPEDWRLQVTTGPSDDAQAEALSSADIAFVMATPMPAELIRKAPKLRFIQKLGAGTDRIDTAHCAANGIAVARLQAGNAVPVAEHTLLMILAAGRRLPLLDRQTRAGEWDKEECRGMNRQISGRTLGIVGFGAIGRALARLLSGFEAELLYYDPIRADPDIEKALGVRYRPLDALLEEADIVSLHLPLMPETQGLIGAERLARMKKGSILVNCARGGLVDEAALYESLKAGHLFAAGIDAFAKEPPVGSPLLTVDTVVVTPHAAGATLDNFDAVAARAVANTRAFLAGESLPAADVVVAP